MMLVHSEPSGEFFQWREAGDTPAGLTLAGWFDMYHTQTGSNQVARSLHDFPMMSSARVCLPANTIIRSLNIGVMCAERDVE